MSEAPERISVYPLEGTWGYGGMEFAEGDEPGLVEYVRADRIEELEAKLKSETERLGREVNLARYGQPDFAWSIHVQAMAELEAKLAKAVEALQNIAYGGSYTDMQIARSTLAELTGEAG